MVVAEVKFLQLAVKVLLAAMLIDALHAAFENAEVAFNGVGVNVAANVFLGAVADGFVSRVFLARLGIEAAFVRM
jgi:hypothetical protein